MFEIIEPLLKMQPTIQIHSGKYFDILHPEDSDFTIEDIAWALSHINRFTGHTSVPYNVAQHSLLVSALVPKRDAMAGLLHDGSEAFLGDVSSPLKQLLPEYKVIEARVEAAIFERFGLKPGLPASVKEADTVMLLTERRDLMPFSEHSAWNWAAGVQPTQQKIVPMTPADSRWFFLNRFKFILENY